VQARCSVGIDGQLVQTVVHALLTANIHRQMRFDALSLFIAQPDQVLTLVRWNRSGSDYYVISYPTRRFSVCL
jgi:hypothetical protein